MFNDEKCLQFKYLIYSQYILSGMGPSYYGHLLRVATFQPRRNSLCSPVLQTFFPALKLPLSHFEHTSSSLKSFDNLIKIRVFILINTVEIFSVSRKSKNRISCAVITLLLYPCSEFYKKHLLSLLEVVNFICEIRVSFLTRDFLHLQFLFCFYLDSYKGEESEHGLNLSIFFENRRRGKI